METSSFFKNLFLPSCLLPIRRIMAVALLLLCCSGLSFDSSLTAADIDESRSDVLTFHGSEKVVADSLSADSFLVVLDCKTETPQQYSFILRGIDPVEKALLQDIRSGQWAARFGLFRSAMIIEGIRDPQLIRAYEDRLNALVTKVMVTYRSADDSSPQALTRILFEAMHQEILTKEYNIDCTELSKVMQTGEFNCVSATVLFNCLAEKAGLNVCALEMPGHALSRVKFAGGISMDLETTCPTWFELTTEAERQMATRRVAPSTAQTQPMTGNSTDNTGTPQQPLLSLAPLHREISPVQLLATIYYNIGVDLLTTKMQHPEAMAVNLKALYLDRENEQAWANLCAAINNRALELTLQKKKYDLATILLEQGVALDPEYDQNKFRHNQVYVFYEWISGLARLGHFDKAREVFTYANQRIPNDKHLLELMSGVDLAEKKVKR